MDNMAYEIEQLKAYKEDSEYWINELRQDINNAWDRYEEQEINFDWLVKSQVIDDQFWVNEPGYQIQTSFCFDPIVVYESQTLDFSANFTTDSNNRDESTYFGIYIKVDGVLKAQGVAQEYQENEKVANNSVSMIYRETV